MDMTQKELAEHLQISDSTLSYWEMGRYDPDNEALLKLSKFFHVPIDYILGGDFKKWDIDTDRVSYQDTDTHYLSGNGIFVSEHNTVYNQSGISGNLVDSATSNSQLRTSDNTQDTYIIKPGAPSEAVFDFRTMQTSFDRIEFEGLTQKETDLLAEYAMFIKSRRK